MKVPTDETLTVVQDKLATDPSLEEHTCIPVGNLMEMQTFCVKATYFRIESYIATRRRPSYGILSPVQANVYMEYFKEMILRSTSLKPSMWLRYVDDTFFLWPHQKNIQVLMNSIYLYNSQWRKNQTKKLSFVDVLITCKDQGFSTSIY